MNNSAGVLCEKAILLSEATSTNPRENAVFVKHYSTHVWKRRLDLRNCSCDGISFNPNWNISNLSMPGKADVKIISSISSIWVSDIGIKIIPNNKVIIEVNKKGNYYEVIGFDICQQYVVSVLFKVAPARSMFKINSSVMEFPKEKFTVDESYCFYNQTHINITMNSVKSRELYLNLTLLNGIFMKNITNTVTLPTQKFEDISF